MINLDLVPVLNLLANRYNLSGNVMTLGRQEIGFSDEGYALLKKEKILREGLSKDSSGAYNQEDILKNLGFNNVHSIDVSDFEGATHIVDLNVKNALPQEIIAAYDLVLNGGTLEHCFDVGQALRNTVELVKPGGHFLQIGPMNNWVDHGFYQFSPTLWFDFLELNGFEVLVSASIKIVKENNGPTRYHLDPIEPFEAPHLSKDFAPERIAQMVLARRTTDCARPFHSPNQSFYALQHGQKLVHAEVGAFIPYLSENGVLTEKLKDVITIDKNMVVASGAGPTYFEVEAPYVLRENAARPYSSKVVGIPLRYKMAQSGEINEHLPGRFRHKENRVTFSSSDGSSVLENAYEYSFAVY